MAESMDRQLGASENKLLYRKVVSHIFYTLQEVLSNFGTLHTTSKWTYANKYSHVAQGPFPRYDIFRSYTIKRFKLNWV